MALADAIDTNNALVAMGNVNDANDIPLSMVLDSAIQRTYHELTLMTELFPSTPDDERKIQLIKFACRTWQLFLRVYALVKFKRKAHINVSNIMSFLNQQKFMFIDTANYFYDLSHVRLLTARLPNFSIPTAVDVLTTGTYPRLPTCIKERILPPEPINDNDKSTTLLNLNRIIQCRLALSELPAQFHNFQIENGHVKFYVKNEFEVMLTVVSDDYKKPWRLLFVKILVKNAQDPNRTIVMPQQVYHIHDILQTRLYDSEKPLLDLFRSLHFFCQSLKLEILLQQMAILNAITSDRFYKICEYVNSKQLTIKYWLEYSKNEYDFRFSIINADYSDYLQTSHYPPLNLKDHKEIDCIFKSSELLIEKLIHQVVRIRSRRRLLDLKSKFISISYCTVTLEEDKPALKIQFLNTKFENEALFIMIDYYSGLFYVNIPFSPPNLSILTSIESCLNVDISKLELNMLKLRSWFMLKSCEISLRHLSYKCTYELPIVSYSEDYVASLYSKIEPNRLYLQLKKHESTYMMITCKTKEDLNNSKEEINWHENAEFIDDENAIRINYYLIKLVKCKYDGEYDSTSQYLKLISISHLKRNSIINFLDLSVNYLLNNKIEYNSSSKLLKSYEITRNGCIYELIKVVSSVEERLPLLNFISTLSKHNIITQSIQIDSRITSPSINILSPPKLDTKELEVISEDLWKKVLKCTIRKIDYPKVNFINFKIVQIKNNYSIEFKLREKLFDNKLQESYLYNLNQYYHDTQQYQLFNQQQQTQSQLDNQLIEPKKLNIDFYVAYLEIKNFDDIYETFKLEWQSICQMYKLLKQVFKAYKSYPELKKQMHTTYFNFKQLVINYGPNYAYKILLQWSKETKQYDVHLLVNNNQFTNTIVSTIDTPLFNYQFLYINEIRKLFNHKNMNIVNLVQILNETCVPTFSLAKLCNLPKFYAHMQQILPLAGFMLLIISLTHFKLTYYSRYCLEIHIHNNRLVSIRDGSFGLTDMSMAIEDLHPIQLLSSFLSKFCDDTVEELLKRRSSMVEDDNPISPIQTSNTSSTTPYMTQPQQTYQQPIQQPHSQPPPPHQQHVFLPPTSPAVRPSIPPSPIHNYVVQSPGGVSQTNTIPSIAPSPGSFQNFGSPAIMPHSSPGAPLMSHTAAPSPGGFLSPAAQVQSPANSYDFSLQSPMQTSMPSKSPFNFAGPSPNPSGMNMNANATGMNAQIKDSLEDVTKSASTGGRSGTHYKKYYSASIPAYLSHNGFIKMLTPNAETGYTPLETFLASNHLKKALLKYIQQESFRQIPEQNSTIISFATKLLKIQIVNEITKDYTAFSLNILPIIDQFQTDILQEYFHTKILCPPYRSAAALAFFELLSIPDVKALKDFIQLLECELNQTFGYKIRFSWIVPFGYRLKTPNSALSAHYNSHGPAFYRKDKYYFLISLVNTNSARIPQAQFSMSFLMAYDPNNCLVLFEPMKQTHDVVSNQYAMHENRIIHLLNQFLDSARSRNEQSPLAYTFSLLLGTLNQPPATPMTPMMQNMM